MVECRSSDRSECDVARGGGRGCSLDPGVRRQHATTDFSTLSDGVNNDQEGGTKDKAGVCDADLDSLDPSSSRLSTAHSNNSKWDYHRTQHRLEATSIHVVSHIQDQQHLSHARWWKNAGPREQEPCRFDALDEGGVEDDDGVGDAAFDSSLQIHLFVPRDGHQMHLAVTPLRLTVVDDVVALVEASYLEEGHHKDKGVPNPQSKVQRQSWRWENTETWSGIGDNRSDRRLAVCHHRTCIPVPGVLLLLHFRWRREDPSHWRSEG